MYRGSIVLYVPFHWDCVNLCIWTQANWAMNPIRDTNCKGSTFSLFLPNQNKKLAFTTVSGYISCHAFSISICLSPSCIYFFVLHTCLPASPFFKSFCYPGCFVCPSSSLDISPCFIPLPPLVLLWFPPIRPPIVSSLFLLARLLPLLFCAWFAPCSDQNSSLLLYHYHILSCWCNYAILVWFSLKNVWKI